MSNSSPPDDPTRAVEQLKQEIDSLFELQNEDLKRATYLGMTPDEAKVIAERRRQITALADRLAKLKASELIDQEKLVTTLPGVVREVIPSPHPSVPEKAEIEVKGADDLYREIRIDNTFTNKDGEEVGLKKGAEVEVTIEADEEDTTKR